MDDSSRAFLRSLAAVLFLGVLAFVLARPVFQSGDGRPARDTAQDGPRAEAETPAEVESSPPELPSPSPTRKRAAATLVYGSYPRECLRPVPEPAGLGLVAAMHYGKPGRPHQVSTGSPAGGAAKTFPGSGPLQWSPSGEWLALRGLELRDATGRRVLFEPGAEPWAWSPLSDCLVVAERDRLVVVQPPARKTVLVDGYGMGSPFFFALEGLHLWTSEGEIDLTVDPVRPVPSSPGQGPVTCDLGPRVRQEDCAPVGDLAVGIRAGRLVVGRRGGDALQELTTDERWTDTAPEWGPRGTGVLFVRKPQRGGLPEVWFIAEGGRPRPAGLTLPDSPRAGVGGWDTYLDWSVTPPSGVMPDIPGS